MTTKERKYRILVVDDQDSYRESECLLLRGKGYDIGEAVNPQDAKLRLMETPFHLCLLDNQMPDASGEMQDQAGLELAKWTKLHCPRTSRIIITGYEKVEMVKQAFAEQLVHGYYSKADIAEGHVANLVELVAKTLRERLVTLSAKNDAPLKVDPFDLWGEEGVVERDVYETGAGVVRFSLGAVKAHLHETAGVGRIRAGAKVVGRAVSGGEIEVLPVGPAMY